MTIMNGGLSSEFPTYQQQASHVKKVSQIAPKEFPLNPKIQSLASPKASQQGFTTFGSAALNNSNTMPTMATPGQKAAAQTNNLLVTNSAGGASA